MKKILEKIEKQISYVSEDKGYGSIEICIKNGKVCFIRPSKVVSID